MLRLATPVVWFVNLFVQALLRCCASSRAADVGPTLTQEELRSLVLEGQYFRGKHRTMLANLLDLESITVDDVMTPRNQIHALDLTEQAARCSSSSSRPRYHTRLPVYEDELDNIIGTLHLKQVAPPAARRRASTRDAIAQRAAPAVLRSGGHAAAHPAAAVPERPRSAWASSSTSTASCTGLVTIEDIIEEIIGDFTTQAPGGTGSSLGREPDGSVVVDGMAQLRTLNRKLGTELSAGRARKRSTASSSSNWAKSPMPAPSSRSPGRRSKSCRRRTAPSRSYACCAPVGRAAVAPLQSADGQASSAG